jgi:hypothetical protein
VKIRDACISVIVQERGQIDHTPHHFPSFVTSVAVVLRRKPSSCDASDKWRR